MATGNTGSLKMVELKELGVAELQHRLREWEETLEALRFQHDSGQLPNTTRVRIVRRDIARLKTVIHEHELGHRQPKGKTE